VVLQRLLTVFEDDEILDLEADWKRLRPSKRGRVAHLEDRRFGRLLVLERAGTDKHRASTWRCGCDCGHEVVVSRPNLVGGRVKSCGCLLAEYRKSPKPRVMAIARAVRWHGQPLTNKPIVGFGNIDPDDLDAAWDASAAPDD